MLQEQEASFAFFLGAGCSISSGIPGAATLVETWLPEFHRRVTGGKIPYQEWLAAEFPQHKPDNPGASYAKVMRRLFRFPAQRQRETERICLGKDPGFGYTVLAKLITQESCGTRCNFILTTNFDDMVADALYLHTRQKPLVIIHDSLMGFAETGRTRPLVIKLHGDALLEPKHVEEETFELDPKMCDVLADLLTRRGLIFVGYGGNDRSVYSFLKQLPLETLTWGVYWINDQIPDNDFGIWLQSRPRAIWVKHLRFDELMLLMRAEFGLAHPEERRFQDLMKTYFETFQKLEEGVAAKPESPDKRALTSAVEKAAEEFTDWWAVQLAADKFEMSDPDKADAIYRQGLEKFPTSHQLIGNYANFLADVRKDFDQAESCYKRALDADPNDADYLNNYADFLETNRRDFDQAEAFYKRALEADPNHANNLGNYAIFLWERRQDFEQAESCYKRALESDPNHALQLGNYAKFLADVREDFDQAESFYKRALQADPNHANNLGNYALFLQNVRKNFDQAEAFYKRACEADPNHSVNLGNYAGLLLSRGEREKGMSNLQKALSLANPNSQAPQFLECHFYRLANGPAEQKAEALRELHKLLVQGVRSPGWDLSWNIERAEKDGHPNVALLKALAAVIADGADPATLDQFKEWRNVK